MPKTKNSSRSGEFIAGCYLAKTSWFSALSKIQYRIPFNWFKLFGDFDSSRYSAAILDMGQIYCLVHQLTLLNGQGQLLRPYFYIHKRLPPVEEECVIPKIDVGSSNIHVELHYGLGYYRSRRSRHLEWYRTDLQGSVWGSSSLPILVPKSDSEYKVLVWSSEAFK